ncbi:hypothetical protein [Burkholderia contaminans]|uniref:hypothetical protein n=1 Tax=Burkholderia contaminans TaxID=488447 RepID=UPI002D8086A5|nr:hypothetical protein [Burkholderia contaminans]
MKTAVALALRLVLGAFWIWAGSTKIVGHFDAGPFLTAAVSRSTVAPEAVRLVLAGAIGHVALPHVVAVNLVVPWLELAAGLSILLGIATAWGGCRRGGDVGAVPHVRGGQYQSIAAVRRRPVGDVSPVCARMDPSCVAIACHDYLISWRVSFRRMSRSSRACGFFSCQACEIFKRGFKKLTSG